MLALITLDCSDLFVSFQLDHDPEAKSWQLWDTFGLQTVSLTCRMLPVLSFKI